jgi:hypothetical protein
MRKLTTPFARDRLAFQRLPSFGHYVLAEDQVLTAELLTGNIPEIRNPLIGYDGWIVDPGGGELGLVVLGCSLLVSVSEKHRHLHAEPIARGMVRNVPDRGRDDAAGRRDTHNWIVGGPRKPHDHGRTHCHKSGLQEFSPAP